MKPSLLAANVSGELCQRRLSPTVRHCGAPAEYRIWGSPCSCDAVYKVECVGHPICGSCAAELRAKAVPVSKLGTETFQVTRICSLADTR